MELKEVILKRHSVRKYNLNIIVTNEVVAEIIKLAEEAPSAGGLKAYHIFITSLKVANQVDAPMYLVVCADSEKSAKKYGDRGRNLYAIQDATILASYIQLIAVDMGLSTVWIGAFNEDRIRKQLNIGKHLRPIAIIPIGYE